jgi:glucose/arabinose dehydrogenase
MTHIPLPLSARACARVVAVLCLAGLVAAAPAPVSGATLPTGFTETLVASGLSSPTAMAFAPDGRLFVCQQGGQLRVIKNGTLLATPFVTLTVSSAGERGLLGVTFDPDFANNRFVYVYYTATTPAVHNRVSRFTANGDVALAGSETILLELNNLSSATNHNGGALHFGPDGKLYIAVGENANSANSQTLGNLLGKILRINPDGSIPTDNPFFSQATGVNRAIWAMGLRNPFTFAFQPGTGRMFINDVGQNAWEEINEGIAGANYGWPDSEGPTSNPAHDGPLFFYGHGSSGTTGCAITGGAFYNPEDVRFPPEYEGQYFFADFCSNWIRRLSASFAASGFATGAAAPVDLRVTDDGSLYYLARGSGSIFRVEYTANEAPSITTHPATQTVPVGGSATFNVAASGTAPLAYQWQRGGTNIPGATGASYTLSSVSLADDGATFRAVVSNSFGAATSNAATLDVTSNNPPTATIISPANNTLYNAGDTINYSGTGTDPEDGTVPASRFTWQVDFHHDTHTHPFVPPTSGAAGGSFVIPTTGETAANVWYRIHLTVRDAGGLTHSTFSDVVPRKSTFTLATSPAGLQLTLDGQPLVAPQSVQGVVGIQRTLGAPSPQTVGGTTYEFVSWSDGGAATHQIATPASDTTYTATFRVSTVPPGTGLLGTYFNNVNFTGTSLTRLDPTVNFSWGAGAPIAGIGADTFSVVWSGQVRAKVTGTHTFYTVSDDGVRLFVNGQAVINNWTDHAPTENAGTIVLTAGQKYDIRLEFYENGGGASAQLRWSGPGLAKEVVPQSHLHPYVLLVAGSTTLTAGDAAVRARLLAGGHSVIVRTATAATTAHAAGMALVLVSSTVTSANVNTKFRAVVNPVLTWESNLFDDLGMTGLTSGTDFGTLTARTQVDIVTAAHPLAGGLAGRVTVTASAQTFSWGRPNGNAVVAARPAGDTTRAAIFGYERGAAMPGRTAPGRRVGFFLEDGTAAALSAAGATLFDAAVRWAAGP